MFFYFEKHCSIGLPLNKPGREKPTFYTGFLSILYKSNSRILQVKISLLIGNFQLYTNYEGFQTFFNFQHLSTVSWGVVFLTLVFEVSWPCTTFTMLLLARKCTWQLRIEAWLLLCPYLLQLLGLLWRLVFVAFFWVLITISQVVSMAPKIWPYSTSILGSQRRGAPRCVERAVCGARLNADGCWGQGTSVVNNYTQ